MPGAVIVFLILFLAVSSAQEPADEKPEPVYTSVTVTASRGAEEEARTATRLVTVRTKEDIQARALPTVGHLLETAPGILLQQSTTAQVSPFLRGLTGYQVLNLVDGVRFNNSTFRSGPNQYLAFLEPSQFERVEAMLGPAGALYGSDALGGTIQLLTASAPFSSSGGSQWHGEFGVFGGSADLSGGANARLLWSTPRFSWLAGGSGRKHNDLRGGGGADSRHALRRFLGLDDAMIREMVGGRMRDTAFTQSSAHTKFAFKPGARHLISGLYQYGEQFGVDGYKDLWGGLGRMRSQFTPQVLHFGYFRYEVQNVLALDSIGATFSMNSQTDGSIRQGLAVTGTLTEEQNRLNAYGYAVQGAKRFGTRSTLIFGTEIYDEHAGAWRRDNGRAVRALYPDGARYTTVGTYGQVSADFGWIRTSGGLRHTGVRFAQPESRQFSGIPATEQTFGDVTYQGSASVRLGAALQWNLLVGRGFRAPNLNDLGAIGLNDLGYEIPAAEAAGALLGDSAGEGALPLGRAVAGLKAEHLWNYETGFSAQTRRLYFRTHLFDAELRDPIVRRTLLFPASAPPTSLAGLPVTVINPTAAQRAAGVVTVAAAVDPRAVKAFVNDGKSRYYGIESFVRFGLTSNWRIEGGYHYLVGRDLNPNRNIRRLPPQSGFAALRYLPGSGRRPWWEIATNLSGRQERLSGGDRDDERIGASRSRSDIAAFFNGSRLAPWVDANRRFLPTGESLPQIQARVLPGVTSDTLRVPTYATTAGWMVLHLRAGLPVTERLSINVALENLLDKNYRYHGSGTDAPGFNAWVGVRWQF